MDRLFKKFRNGPKKPMKVGLIGLGRIGEGMSRRMIEKGIEDSTSDITKCQELEKYCSKLGISYIFSGVYGAPYAINACSKIFQSLSPGVI